QRQIKEEPSNNRRVTNGTASSHGLLEQRRHVPLVPLGAEVELPAGLPPEPAEADAVEDGHVGGVELRPEAEEVVQPEDAAGPEHPVDVEERGLEHGVRHPVAEHVHGVHDVEHAVGEGEPLHERDLQRHEAPGGDEAVEGRVQVQRRGHHRHVALPHARREGAGAAADVQPDAHRAGGAGPQHAVDAEPGPAVVGLPPPALLPLQVEAVLAEVGPAPGARALHEAGVVLARVGRPAHGGVRRDRPQAPGERRRLHVPRRRPRPAASAGQRLAPLERQLQREGVVVGALAADVVRHVLRQLLLEVAAGEAEAREQLVGAEVGVVAERQPVGLDGQLQLAPGLLRPAAEVLGLRRVTVHGAEPREHGLEEVRRRVALRPQGRELGARPGQRGARGVEVAQQRGRVPQVDHPRRGRRKVHGQRRAGEEVDGDEVGRDDDEQDLELGAPRRRPRRRPVPVAIVGDTTTHHRLVSVLLMMRRRVAPVLRRVHGRARAAGDRRQLGRSLAASIDQFALYASQ
ncbi:hypothetical protein BS78_06G108700, partial [Paspalum vaginatum]